MNKRESNKQMLVDLLYVVPQLKLYYSDNSNFNKLISFLSEKDYCALDDLPYPTFKEVSDQTGLSVGVVRKMVKKMYNELLTLENEHFLNFNRIEIVFLAVFDNRIAVFRTNKIEILPRVGETVEVPFFKARLGVSLFFVERIKHSFQGDVQRIYIDLTSGIYNMFWHYRLDKALSTGEIGIQELISLNDREIKHKLGIY
ncbi:hypothetical protein [Maribacter dokdonensis]|uniref:hypothetical protein n=1 Tax=Maribacter dokdonensis TaxID=320912 RepID=UPI002735B90D|nr:hypothetical protein [Maribacter dokdonensis]MDP2525649.1 hypothetical protein [Maribacter dokdonensis]